MKNFEMPTMGGEQKEEEESKPNIEKELGTDENKDEKELSQEFEENVKILAQKITELVKNISPEEFEKKMQTDDFISAINKGLIDPQGQIGFDKDPKNTKVFLESFSYNVEKFLRNSTNLRYGGTEGEGKIFGKEKIESVEDGLKRLLELLEK